MRGVTGRDGGRSSRQGGKREWNGGKEKLNGGTREYEEAGRQGRIRCCREIWREVAGREGIGTGTEKKRRYVVGGRRKWMGRVRVLWERSRRE